MKKECPKKVCLVHPLLTFEAPLHILPLYSLLEQSQQMRIFETPPSGSRLVIVATNIAETSLTIPGVRYVVDSGKVKQREHASGSSFFRTAWTSKASSDQRAGRAGRTAPGHCYRLYSSAVYSEYFPEFNDPEIKRTPTESVVLALKNVGVQRIVGFPFPTPLDDYEIRDALNILEGLGCCEPNGGKVTVLGNLVSQFPVHPRYGKMYPTV